MATGIPTYRRQIVADNLGPMPRASGESPVGRALQGLGQTGANFVEQRNREAERQRKVLEQKEEEDARAWTASALANDQVKWLDRQSARESEAEPGAPNFAKDLLGEFDKYRDEAMKNAPTERAKTFYGERLNALRTNLFGDAVRFEAQAGVKWRIQQAGDAADAVAQLATIDPERGKTAIAEQEAIFAAMPNRALAAQFSEALRTKVTRAGASGMVERDPAGSLQLLDARLNGKATGNLYVDGLDGDQLVTLRHRAASYVAQGEAKAQAATDKALKDAKDALDELMPFALDGRMPDPDYEQIVLARVRGTPYEAAAKTMLKQAAAGAGHGAQTLPRQEVAIRALEAQLAAGSSPEAEKILARARTITDSQRAAFKDNPWAAGTRFQRLPPVPEVQIADATQAPQLVLERLKLMAAYETAAGAPISPLQPAEAKALADRLKALPPDAVSEVLGQIGGLLNVGRVAALAEQLDKGNKPLALSLKLGLDRTTAGRTTSALVLRGAQALADKAVKRDDQALTGWRSSISAMVRGALGDERAEQDVIDAAYYVRAAMDTEGSAVPGFDLDAGNEQAVRLVIGQPIERSGVKTILPRGMSEGDFDDKAKAALQRLAGQTLYVRGRPVSAEAIAARLDGYGMKRDGEGRYTPVSGGAYVTLDKEGTQPLRLGIR